MRAIIKTAEYERKKEAIERYYAQFRIRDDIRYQDEATRYSLDSAIDDALEDLDEEFTVDIE